MVNSDRWGEAIQTEHNWLDMSNTSSGSQSECKSLSSLVTPLPGTVKKQPTVETSTVMSDPTFGAESSNEDNDQEESLPPSSEDKNVWATMSDTDRARIVASRNCTSDPQENASVTGGDNMHATSGHDILDHKSAWPTGANGIISVVKMYVSYH